MEIFIALIIIGATLMFISSRPSPEKSGGRTVLDGATPWLTANGFNPQSVKFSVYREPELMRHPGATLIIGMGETSSGGVAGFLAEVTFEQGTIYGALIEPSPVVTYHESGAVEARQSDRPLADVMLEMAARWRARRRSEEKAGLPAMANREVSERAGHGRVDIVPTRLTPNGSSDDEQFDEFFVSPQRPRQQTSGTTSVYDRARLHNDRNRQSREELPTNYTGSSESQLATSESVAELQRILLTLPTTSGYMVLSGQAHIRFVIVHGENVQAAFDGFMAWAATAGATSTEWLSFSSHGFYEPRVAKVEVATADVSASDMAQAEAAKRSRIKPGSVWAWPACRAS